MRILMHVCCAPCSIHPLSFLREEGHQVTGHFFNPNIHPYTECKKRMDTLTRYAGEENFKVIADGSYRLEDFLRATAYREQNRCRFCYAMRLEETARLARHGHFDAFTTTLLVSPYQKHELIRQTGEALSGAYGVPFYYVDFRPGYKEARARARELSLYLQSYCGCIYSEKERYYRENRKP